MSVCHLAGRPRGRGEHALQDERGDRAEPLGEQLLSELRLDALPAHHGHQSGGIGGQSSA